MMLLLLVAYSAIILVGFSTVYTLRGTYIKRLFWPPYEVKKIKVALHKFLLISLLHLGYSSNKRIG